jgi:hypothetical protein
VALDRAGQFLSAHVAAAERIAAWRTENAERLPMGWSAPNAKKPRSVGQEGWPGGARGFLDPDCQALTT